MSPLLKKILLITAAAAASFGVVATSCTTLESGEQVVDWSRVESSLELAAGTLEDLAYATQDEEKSAALMQAVAALRQAQETAMQYETGQAQYQDVLASLDVVLTATEPFLDDPDLGFVLAGVRSAIRFAQAYGG